MRAGRGILLALAALGIAGCDRPTHAPDASATVAPSPPAADPTPLASASGEGPPERPSLAPEEAERAFAEAVRGIAAGLESDSAAPYVEPDDVFIPLRKAGLAGETVDGEADYYAWVRPRGSLRFFGHDVALVFAEEMRRGFIGCCINRGVTLVLRKNGDLARLQQFADDRRCKLQDADTEYMLDSVGAYGRSLRSSELLALSCHERDILE